jgi:hypothetical protein
MSAKWRWKISSDVRYLPEVFAILWTFSEVLERYWMVGGVALTFSSQAPNFIEEIFPTETQCPTEAPSETGNLWTSSDTLRPEGKTIKSLDPALVVSYCTCRVARISSGNHLKPQIKRLVMPLVSTQ